MENTLILELFFILVGAVFLAAGVFDIEFFYSNFKQRYIESKLRFGRKQTRVLYTLGGTFSVCTGLFSLLGVFG